MIKSELQEIKDRLICPKCQSIDIDIWFINTSGSEIDPSYVNDDQESSDLAHVCTCRDCGNEDDRCFFDHVEFKKWEIIMHRFVQSRNL